jgi:copper chaperone
MVVFEVKDMTCGHCVASVTRAVQAVDAQAKVQIDLAQHRVEIETGSAPVQALQAAIEDAGFTPVPV